MTKPVALDSELPKFCYAFLPSDQNNPRRKVIRPIIIKRGEYGYHQTNWDWNAEHAQEALDSVNGRLGVTKEQVDQMFIKSMFHWPRKQ